MPYFTKEKIAEMIKHGWELIRLQSGRYLLRQKDKHYLKTVEFDLIDSVANNFLAKGVA